MAIHFVLYRYFDADENLLYIGMTKDFRIRNSAHSCRSVWFPLCAKVTIQFYDDPQILLKAEAEAIRLEKPIYNYTHNEEKIAEKRAIKKTLPPSQKKEKRPYIPREKHIYVADCIKKYGIPDDMEKKCKLSRSVIVNMSTLKIKTHVLNIKAAYTYFKRREK